MSSHFSTSFQAGGGAVREPPLLRTVGSSRQIPLDLHPPVRAESDVPRCQQLLVFLYIWAFHSRVGHTASGASLALRWRAGARGGGTRSKGRAENVKLLWSPRRSPGCSGARAGCRPRSAHGRAVDDIHRPGVADDSHVLPMDPDGQVVEAVVVEVARGESRAEKVARLGHVGDARAVLVPDLAACGGQPRAEP